MKTIYITGSDRALLDYLPQVTQKFKELSVVGVEEISEDTIRNCGLFQPDFVITDYFSEDQARDILTGCPNTFIVIINDDLNRSSALITTLNQENLYNILCLDKQTSPNELCQMLIDFDSNAEFGDAKEIKEHKAEPQKESISLEELNNAINAEEQGKDAEVFKEEKKEEVKASSPLPSDKPQIPSSSTNNSTNEVPTNYSENVTSFVQELNLSNFKSKSIAIFSKKGGTGKSTIAKELANVFSSVKLPKKLANGSQTLKTIVVDMDFERGSIRSYLGVDNPMPNIYVWINDILTKIEDGVPIERIYYPSMQVLQNYTILLTGAYRILLTDQGDLPTRTISRLEALDQDGTLLSKIILLIVKCLRKTFDVIIYDLGSDFNDISKTILEEADDIIYPMLPTFADIENFKSFNDDIRQYERINPAHIKIVMNQYSKKINFTNDFDEVLKYVKYQTVDNDTNRTVETPYNCLLKIPYNINVYNVNNNIRGIYFLTTHGSSLEKQIYLKLASIILPIFKVKNTNAQLNAIKQKQASKKKANDKNKAPEVKNVSKPLEEFKDEKTSDNTSVEKKIGFKEFIMSDLTKETYETFVEKLKQFKEVKCFSTGFPQCEVTPKKINKNVWKQYNKQYKVEIKNAIKNKKNKK